MYVYVYIYIHTYTYIYIYMNALLGHRRPRCVGCSCGQNWFCGEVFCECSDRNGMLCRDSIALLGACALVAAVAAASVGGSVDFRNSPCAMWSRRSWRLYEAIAEGLNADIFCRVNYD